MNIPVLLFTLLFSVKTFAVSTLNCEFNYKEMPVYVEVDHRRTIYGPLVDVSNGQPGHGDFAFIVNFHHFLSKTEMEFLDEDEGRHSVLFLKRARFKRNEIYPTFGSEEDDTSGHDYLYDFKFKKGTVSIYDDKGENIHNSKMKCKGIMGGE